MGTSHHPHAADYTSYTNRTQHKYYLLTTTNIYGNYCSHNHHNQPNYVDYNSPSHSYWCSPCPSHNHTS